VPTAPHGKIEALDVGYTRVVLTREVERLLIS
jgi:hypothetical protein